ncbi:NAD-dependent epimerase/dehydratase family protein [Actinopolymorpha sp. B11F2]|uniref:polysaccharide biosynthesis C-terminal domain-containing protein n=1 Tax=Actinopolymorpha sp. B11F2 TaxID=3160862 RepID=UPI0032E46C7D
MKVVVTGAGGFLGWHLRARLHALTSHEIVPIDRRNFDTIDRQVRNADVIFHVAGVNRGSDSEVEKGNVELAHAVANAVRKSWDAPRLAFANSIMCGNDSPYGRGKAEGRDILAAAATSVGSPFVDVVLPNLFGEHGRPRYNSFVATFAHAAANRVVPEINDRQVELLHVQQAAKALMDAIDVASAATIRPQGEPTSVAAVWQTLSEAHSLYRSGDIPPLATQLDVDLFNTLRAAMFPHAYPVSLPTKSDHRGDLVECVRAHGGQGQSFISKTVPGVTRGEHFHLGKIERFLVLRGRARISLRRLFHDEVVSFDVAGDEPAVIDMPTMWVHNITNTGADELVTFFWTHTIFDPDNPDTYAEKVDRDGVVAEVGA